MKKHKKRELVFPPTTRGCNWYCSTFFLSYDGAEYLYPCIPGPMRPGLSQSTQNTHHFTSLKSELALPSTGSWLQSRLSSNWRWAERIFSNSKSEKRDGAKKAWVYARKRNVDTYDRTKQESTLHGIFKETMCWFIRITLLFCFLNQALLINTISGLMSIHSMEHVLWCY